MCLLLFLNQPLDGNQHHFTEISNCQSFDFPFHPSPSATHAVEGLTGLSTPQLFFGSSQGKKSLWGLLFLLFDSIYMGSSGLGVYYVTLAGCEEQ